MGPQGTGKPEMLTIETAPVNVHKGPKGQLIKAWPKPVSGEVYVVDVSRENPRGHHIHELGYEWFIALSGEPKLIIEDPATKERAVVTLKGVRAKVPAGMAHVLVQQGPEKAVVMAVCQFEHNDEVTTSYLVDLNVTELKLADERLTDQPQPPPKT